MVVAGAQLLRLEGRVGAQLSALLAQVHRAGEDTQLPEDTGEALREMGYAPAAESAGRALSGLAYRG